VKNIVILISGGGSNMAAIVKTAQREDWAQRFGARVAAVVSNKASAGGLEFLARRPLGDGSTPSLRWVLVHMIEEYARHNGHADLLREAIDGLTGE